MLLNALTARMPSFSMVPFALHVMMPQIVKLALMLLQLGVRYVMKNSLWIVVHALHALIQLIVWLAQMLPLVYYAFLTRLPLVEPVLLALLIVKFAPLHQFVLCVMINFTWMMLMLVLHVQMQPIVETVRIVIARHVRMDFI